ncbi:MAG: NADH-quinone oxidoreductase subunit C [Candidatus Omnitrophica bacterium]|nr:NADH-quinone oxidoreductase subunit C [Candidatus Omnitrophota bacterium]MBI2174050.1 NADH-quinone oxidoreductase subunit C [Candidatus Omnitrophota bacterium]MBI3010313.1 NADH-quinone oxidoreductase subunit C [Candidatus Omnitrophota bacterium]
MTLRLTETIQQRFSQQVLLTHHSLGQETVVIDRAGLLLIAEFLRDDPHMRFDFLMDLTAVDYLKFGRTLSSAPTLKTPSPLPYFMKPKPSANPWQRGVSNDEFRFEVVYHFYSSEHNHRLRLKVPLNVADLSLASLTQLWASANWFEREVWDLFGITFNGHPNLRRILMYESFEGHPLRKDYPVRKRQPIIGPLN